MRSDPCCEGISLKWISDEAAIEILDFLQIFTANFETRYVNHIRRYYSGRSLLKDRTNA